MPRTVRKAGIKLAPLSAWELMQARQEAGTLAQEQDCFGLCLNACVLARAMRRKGQPVYQSGEAVLQAMQAETLAQWMQAYLRHFADKPMEAYSNLGFNEKRFQELKSQ